MNYHSNPFARGCFGLNNQMSYLAGMNFGSALLSGISLFSNRGTGYYPQTFNPYSQFALNNPFISGAIFNTPIYSTPSYRSPIVYPYFSGEGYGALASSFDYNSKKSNDSSKSFNTSGNGYKLGTSKIKPGLLKGNLVGKEDLIVELCKKYNVDVALVVTIIGQESGFGTSNLAKHNNFMGYKASGDLGKNPKGFGYFSTVEKGLDTAIKNLSKYPKRYASVKKADMNNIDAIGKIYCEGSSYSAAVKNLYNTTVKSYLA
ncbi:glucosaminidase domain-containing protein [bacterium]|nr:glucosaminidase domain-containing protein [bacterium]